MKEKLKAFWAWLKPLLVQFGTFVWSNKKSFFVGLGIGFLMGLIF